MAPHRSGNLAEARQHLVNVHTELEADIVAFDEETDYEKAQKAWKRLHARMLELKGAINGAYKHISELKPKKADKLKPGGKLDNADEGTKRDRKADQKRAEKAKTKSDSKGSKKAERRAAAEPAMSEAGSDEPTGADPDRP